MNLHQSLRTAFGLCLLLGTSSVAAAQSELDSALDAARAATRERLPAGPEGEELARLRAPSLAAVETPERLELLRLRDGSLLFASLLDHSAETLAVMKLEDGGVLELPWSLLDPAQEFDLKRNFGYVAEENTELLVLADRIPLSDGSELIGRIEQRSATSLHLKTHVGIVVLPTARIGGTITQELVPAGDLYTRDELYAQKRDELGAAIAAGGEGASAALLELAVFSEGIRDFVHANEAFAAIKELGVVAPDGLDNSIARTAKKAESQAQADALDEIDRLARRGKFDAAFQQLGVFRGAHPESALTEEADALEQRLLVERERELSKLVTRRWYYWHSRLTREKAREFKEDYEAALDWLDDGVSDELMARLVEDAAEIDPEVTAETLRTLWTTAKRTRTRQASYGNATWLLGKERALSGGVEEEREAEPESDREKERKDLMERIQRYQKNQEAVAKQRNSGAQDELDPADVWRRMSNSERAHWMAAYYAEFSGDMDVVRIVLMNHSDCAGLGAKEVLTMGAEGAQRSFQLDVACGGLGKKRRVIYR